MEVTAVLEALRAISGPIEVVSDSTYVVNCFRDRWWEGWLKRGWMNSQRKPVANRDLWEPLVELVRERAGELTFRWVKGHSGDAMNDFVDELAVRAGKTQQATTGSHSLDVSQGALMARKSGGRADDLEAPSGYRLLVTGHKPPELGGYAPNPTADRTRNKLREIIEAKTTMCTDLIVVNGLALGAEQLAAEAAIEAGVPFAAVLPYPEQERVWPPASRERYAALLARAQGEVLLQATPPASKQAAGAALNRHAAWLARHAQEAVVVWDGEDPYLGRVVRSLQDHLGDTNVWTIPVPETGDGRREG